MREGSAQRRPTTAQRLALDKASDARPAMRDQLCAASDARPARKSRAILHARERRRRTRRRPAAVPKFFLFFDLKFEIRYNKAIIVLIRSEPGSDTTVGEPWRIRITPPSEAAEEQKLGRETINTIQNKHNMTFIGCFSGLPFWRLGAWLRPVSRGNRHFTVGGGRLRQSGPRPEGILLRQPALEGLKRSARTDSPRQVGRNKFPRIKAAVAAAAAAFEERRGGGY
ncbi:hypothetical protein F511_38001 [Dorcoceras hygrometricum]|uniref:Uncharacterized protein n=1 Tax=Dorcoceras hygrometricum TaxID=472368 RepID=A0A2Z7B464_9LAMI|nr:hypothetical protein F511_38001 [Dorcoceras hygrometricum]